MPNPAAACNGQNSISGKRCLDGANVLPLCARAQFFRTGPAVSVNWRSEASIHQ